MQEIDLFGIFAGYLRMGDGIHCSPLKALVTVAINITRRFSPHSYRRAGTWR